MKNINVGIDLGTTYSAVAVFDAATGKVNILKNDIGEEITPSVVYMEDGETLIGQEAKDQQAAGNVNTCAFYKSMMGDENFVRYLDGKPFDAEGLSCVFLSKLKAAVEKQNGVSITGAVITVPAYFNEAQRQATIHAGEKAGFKVLKIINEPTAAIIAYGLTGGGKKTAMVYDLGGGTFDVTIAKIDGAQVDVIATNGDHQLGGRNWDKVLVDEIVDRFEQEFGVDISANKEDYTELVVRCEKAKKQLTSVAATDITVRSEGYTGKYTITREEFEDKTKRLMAETIMLTEKCFEELGGGFGWNSIDEIVLVGGSTRMPQVFDTIQRKFGKAPKTIGGKVDTIVAAGAAMQAHLCVAGSITLAPTGGGMKAAQFGGAASGGMATLTINSDSIRDVTSHSLGMLAFAGDGASIINSIIIKKNSMVGKPYSKRYTFAGEQLEAYVLQGESTSPYDCTLLYKYVISGMKKGVKNEFTIDFLYDQNGVVQVTGQLASGTPLNVSKSTVSESVSEVIDRLLREKEEAKKRAKVDITFAIDTSGSMSGTPIREAKRSVIEFVSQLGDAADKVSLIGFANSSTWLCRDDAPRAIERAVNKLDADGGTNADPLQYYGQAKGSGDGRVLIVLTDGEWFRKDDAIRSSDVLKGNGVTIYAVGVGEADYKFLERIASPGGAKKIDIRQLVETFKEIADTIATEASAAGSYSTLG